MIPTIEAILSGLASGQYTPAQAAALLYQHTEMAVNACQPHGAPDYEIGFNHARSAVLHNLKQIFTVTP